MKHLVTLDGCDDSTQMEMDLSAEEVSLLERVAALSAESSEYGCQPVMTVKAAPEGVES